MRRKWWILWVCMVLSFGVSACERNQKQQVALEPIETSGQEEDDAGGTDENNIPGDTAGGRQNESSKEQIYVYVCGAVVKAGVYAMPKDSRIYEAIQMAGGFTEQAGIAQINQAEVLEDEAYIYVPTKDEAASGAVSGKQTGQDTKIDLNRADKDELMKIPGVGEAKASQIIQYREEHGRFKKIEDIMNISGIKEGLFEKIRDYIKI